MSADALYYQVAERLDIELKYRWWHWRNRDLFIEAGVSLVEAGFSVDKAVELLVALNDAVMADMGRTTNDH